SPYDDTPPGDAERVLAMCEIMRRGHGNVRYVGRDATLATTGETGDTAGVVVAIEGTLLNVDDLARTLGVDASVAEGVASGERAWGDSVLARLRGSFALALWDAQARTLILARDNAGVRPLHYSLADGRVFFASEVKALLANPEVDRT